MSLCRLCLTSGVGSRIFDDSGGDVAARIKICCRLKVEKDDGLPDCICFECFILLEKLSHFIKVSRESDRILRKNKKLNPIVEMNIEKNDNEENTNDYISDNKSIEHIVEVPIEWEREEDASPLPINPLTDIKKEPESEIIPEDLIKKEISDSEDTVEEECEEPFRENVSQNFIPMKGQIIQNGNCITITKNKKIKSKKQITFKNIGKMKEKKASAHRSIICHICAKEFKEPYRLNCHIKRHGALKKYPCSICKKNFSTSSQCKDHELIHSLSKKFSCKECGKKFSNARYVNKHMRLVHFKNERVKCHLCDKSYYGRYLKQHIKFHLGQRDYECDTCKMRCYSRTGLINHLRLHTGEKPFACKYCSSKFAATKSLTDHERLHTGETPYKCPICEKGFVQKSNMKSHFKYNHKNMDPKQYFPKTRLQN